MSKEQEKKGVVVWVACVDMDGNATLKKIITSATEDQDDDGDYYRKAKEVLEDDENYGTNQVVCFAPDEVSSILRAADEIRSSLLPTVTLISFGEPDDRDYAISDQAIVVNNRLVATADAVFPEAKRTVEWWKIVLRSATRRCFHEALAQ